MSVYEQVRAYHAEHGDDVSEESRLKRYEAILSLADFTGKSVLDVGCGSGAFRGYVPQCEYVGIDLLHGQNVMDYSQKHDVVVANGVLYRLPHLTAAWTLIRYLWQDLTEEVLIFTSLSTRSEHQEDGELHLDPVEILARCFELTSRIALRADYHDRDFCMAMYR